MNSGRDPQIWKQIILRSPFPDWSPSLLPQLNVFVNCIYTVREVRIWDMLVLPTSDCHLCSDMDGLTDVTLRRVDQVINQDVEMEAS